MVIHKDQQSMKYLIASEMNINFLNYVEYDYENYGCQGHCDVDDYCRCGAYSELRPIPDLIGARMALLQQANKGPKYPVKFMSYCVDRLLSHYEYYNENNWEICTRWGYYGEEVESIRFARMGPLRADMLNLLKMLPNDRIRFVLNKEYTYLLPELLNAKFEETIINVSDLDIRSPLKKKYSQYYIDYDLPMGIVEKTSNGKYRIIDGNNRVGENSHMEKLLVIEAF